MARRNCRIRQKQIMSPADSKKTLRRHLRDEGNRRSAEEKAHGSERIRESLKKQEIWKQSRSILFYSPMAGEPDVWPLAGEALAQGKTVGLPRFIGGEHP